MSIETIVASIAESFIPPLKNGAYVLSVFESTAQGDSETCEQNFSVEGTRFSLLPSDIHSVYPPHNMRGSFGHTLPHVVFTRQTLPWQRTLNSTSTDRFIASAATVTATVNEIPWLAVILLDESEYSQIENANMIGSTSVQDLISHDKNIYFPDLKISSEESEQICGYMDLPIKLFCDIMPKPEELILLCHARKSDEQSEEREQWNSVIVGNRLPKATREGRRGYAFLVSLEGFYDFLLNPEAGDYDFVRLTILHQWNFFSKIEQRNLAELFKNLSVSIMNPPQLQTENDTVDEKKEDTKAKVNDLLRRGYVPMQHLMRTGDKTVSFYRGPFVPIKKDELLFDEIGKVASADNLYLYDPELGVFDVSYAAAWQVGRAVSLSQRSIAVKLMKNRNLTHQQLQREMMDSTIKNSVSFEFSGRLNRTINNESDTFGGSLVKFLSEELEAIL